MGGNRPTEEETKFYFSFQLLIVIAVVVNERNVTSFPQIL